MIPELTSPEGRRSRSTTAPSVFPNIVAQSDGDYIGCRITVDNEVKDEKSNNGVHAMTFCMVKSV